MQVSKKCIVLSFLLLSVACDGFSDAQKAERFLTSIGVEAQTQAYPQLLSLYIQYNPNLALPLHMGAGRDALAEKINSIITGTNYFKETVDRFGEVYDEKRVAFYRQWVQTDVGRRITEMEKLASTPEAAYMILAYGATLGQSPPSDKRIELVTRIAQFTGGGAEASELVYQIESGVVAGLWEKLGNDVYIRPAAQTSNEALLDDAVVTSSLYAYQNATIDELVEYVKVLEHKDMEWCLDQLGGVLKNLMFAVSREIGLVGASFFRDSAQHFTETFERLDYSQSHIELEGFTVAFPKPPTLQEESLPSEDGVTLMSIYHASYDEIATSYYASTSTYPQSAVRDKSPNSVLDEVVTGMVGQDKLLIDRKTISLGAIHGYNVLMSAYNGMMLMRSMIFLQDNVLTQITFFAPAYIHFHQKADEFFSAFFLN